MRNNNRQQYDTVMNKNNLFLMTQKHYSRVTLKFRLINPLLSSLCPRFLFRMLNSCTDVFFYMTFRLNSLFSKLNSNIIKLQLND